MAPRKAAPVTRFILRRLGISALILLLGSLILFVLTVYSGDPLEDLIFSTAENRQTLIDLRIQQMNLDLPWYERYWMWLSGVGQCLWLSCDLGTDSRGLSIASSLGAAAVSTLRLVTLATFVAIFVGVSMGILAAIRQYSGFDYAVTFAGFLFYSLPVFWAAVLLKQLGAIQLNTWLADPSVSLTVLVAISLAFAIVMSSLLGGDRSKRLISFGASFVVAFGAIWYFDAVNWWNYPALGPGLIALFGIGAAISLTVLTTGLHNRKVLYAGLTTVAAGLLGLLAFNSVITEGGYLRLFLLLLLSIVVATVIGWFWGGWDKGAAITVSVGTAVLFAGTTVFDQMLRNWSAFLDIKPRPISTIGSGMPNFQGDFWTGVWNWSVQLILPTIVLSLVSLAFYSRFTRASMLEVMGQDYIRTARSKGLSQRVVITKHALRNAMIPLTTIVAFDFAGLIGGAVITETVFGWAGMGQLFLTGLNRVDPGPVMAFYLVTGTAAVVMNMIADIAYGFLDPRIRR